jgi:hypothetical protein
MSTGQGSSGNVIAVVCSFFIPGLAGAGASAQGGTLQAGQLN